MPESGDDFDIVDRYDSIEDPGLRSQFLDDMGTTRPYINGLRRRRDAERKATKAAPKPDESTTSACSGEPRRRTPRTPRRPRVVVTRPPNRGRGQRSYPRARLRVVFIVILKLD
ncbi:hypothetical protein ACFWNT_07365 [Streptomyces sp. NPDC058409]|uniref:hypothetical protein n=1 Tax=Streptomyces sp. NPDC058409 TaxID=3346484 RepID=UPI00364ED773